jgi:DNA-binding transcriptional MerR regulator
MKDKMISEIRDLRMNGLTISQIAIAIDKTPQTVHKIIMTADIHFNSDTIKRNRRDAKLNQLLDDSK